LAGFASGRKVSEICMLILYRDIRQAFVISVSWIHFPGFSLLLFSSSFIIHHDFDWLKMATQCDSWYEIVKSARWFKSHELILMIYLSVFAIQHSHLVFDGYTQMAFGRGWSWSIDDAAELSWQLSFPPEHPSLKRKRINAYRALIQHFVTNSLVLTHSAFLNQGREFIPNDRSNHTYWFLDKQISSIE
jgi:hypothetical protein